MSTLSKHLSPTITDLIRADHADVVDTFRKYRADASPGIKQALVNTVSLALETQAKLKAEIFYPALRSLAPNEAALAKIEAHHQQMHSLIGQLRDMRPTATRYDDTFMSLMQAFLHHVADEETVLLPLAERLLPEQLSELGAQLSKGRRALAGQNIGQRALNAARAAPARTALVTAGGLVAGGYLIKRALERRT